MLAKKLLKYSDVLLVSFTRVFKPIVCHIFDTYDVKIFQVSYDTNFFQNIGRHVFVKKSDTTIFEEEMGPYDTTKEFVQDTKRVLGYVVSQLCMFLSNYSSFPTTMSCRIVGMKTF